MISLRRMPLATRLALLFAAVTALVFGIAGVHLYQSLSEQLQSRDDVLLLSTVDHLRYMLQAFEGMEAVRADPYPLLDVAIRRLRAKVDDPFPHKLVHTRRGMGYTIEEGG